MKPKVCILRSDGTNCDEELFHAFEKAGGKAEYVHVNQLRNKDKKLKDYRILALPGGFSYGDDIAAGKVLAVELTSFLKKEIRNFVKNKGIVLGICNGFQTLVRTGLLPFNNLGEMDVTLAQNESGHFECRWVKLIGEKSRSKFLKEFDEPVEIAVNHGEGKFYTDNETLKKIEKQNLVILRYVDRKNNATQEYPDNPNGSLNAIAGICDPTGRILGLMPHPEKFVDLTQHPNWRRFAKDQKPYGLAFFQNMIKFAQHS